MMIQFWLRLKSQLQLIPLLLLVVAFQLLLSQASGYVLANQQPPLSLAIQQNSNDDLTEELIDDLSNIDGFAIVRVDTILQPEEVFRLTRVQGLLVIPEDFRDKITSDSKDLVTFYAAPGITNSDFVIEQISASLVQLKARQHLDRALGELGAQTSNNMRYETSDLLDVVYNGPIMQGSKQDSTPVFGIAALLILLVFLHTALTVPNRDDKQLLIHGRSAFIRQMIISFMLVWIIWLVMIALFFVLLFAFFGYLPSLSLVLGFIAIMIYSSLLAAVLALCIGRHKAAWIFVPLFLLSMTVGGGLWGNVSVSAALAPLIPVLAVNGSVMAAPLGLFSLAILSLCLIIVLAVFMHRVIIPQKQSLR